MTLTARFHPEAALELDAAILWYDQGGHGRGHVFESAFDSVVDRCLMWPESGRIYPLYEVNLEVRTAKVAGSTFRIVYFVEAEILWVVAVAHERRKPGYWKLRATGEFT